jgi:membrane protease subunit HflC
VIVLVFVGGGYLCLFTVSPTEIVIVTQFGNPVKIITESGLQIKMPSPIQTVNRLDKRLQVFNTKVIQQLTSDKKSLLLQAYCCWKVSNPLKFLQSLGTVENANERLGDIVSSEMGAILGNFELSNLITLHERGSSLPQFEDRLTAISSVRALDLFGIEVTKIGIRQLSLPAENARAVFDRMKAERSRDAARYRAEGEEIASGIQSGAEREKAEILAEAFKEAEIIKGKADARAAKTYADAYNKDLEFFDFLKSMEVYRQVLGANSYLLVSSSSPMFAQFFAERGGSTLITSANAVVDYNKQNLSVTTNGNHKVVEVGGRE